MKNFIYFAIILLFLSCTGQTKKRHNNCYNDTLSYMSFKIFDSAETIQQKLLSKELDNLVMSVDNPQDKDAVYYNPLEVPVVQFTSHIIDNDNNKYKAKVNLFFGENPYLSKIVLTLSGNKFKAITDLYCGKYGDPDSLFTKQKEYITDTCYVWNFAHNQQLLIDKYTYHKPADESLINDVSVYLPEFRDLASDVYRERKRVRIYIIYRDMSYVTQYAKILEEKENAKVMNEAEAERRKEAIEKQKEEQIKQEKEEQDI